MCEPTNRPDKHLNFQLVHFTLKDTDLVLIIKKSIDNWIHCLFQLKILCKYYKQTNLDVACKQDNRLEIAKHDAKNEK